MALDEIEIRQVQGFNVQVAGVPGEDTVERIADLPEDPLKFPAVPSDVVLAEEIDDTFTGFPFGPGPDDVFHQVVVCDMVTCRLADPFVPLAVVREYLDPVAFFCCFCDSSNIVADEPYRARGADVDGPRVKCCDDLIYHPGEFLLTAKDDIRLLHIGREAELGVNFVFGCSVIGPSLVPACSPAVVPAAYRAVGDGHHVFYRADDHAFASRVCATPLRDDAGDGPGICLDLRAAHRRVIFNYEMFLPVFLYRLRVRGQHLIDRSFNVCHVQMPPYQIAASPDSPVRTRTASRIGITKIVPSPMPCSVRFALVIASTIRGTSSSCARMVKSRRG